MTPPRVGVTWRWAGRRTLRGRLTLWYAALLVPLMLGFGVVIYISLAHSLELDIVAEGVETKEQLERLRAEDCDEVQGYYFGRPLPASEFLALAFEAPALVRSA